MNYPNYSLSINLKSNELDPLQKLFNLLKTNDLLESISLQKITVINDIECNDELEYYERLT